MKTEDNFYVRTIDPAMLIFREKTVSVIDNKICVKVTFSHSKPTAASNKE